MAYFFETNHDFTAPLIQAISRMVAMPGDHATGLPQLSFHQRNTPDQATHCIYNLGLGLVLQGEKQVIIGENVYTCRAGHTMLTTMDLPVTSHVTQASPVKPFLAVLLLLDLQLITQLVTELESSAPDLSTDYSHSAFSIETLEPELADAFVRLVQLLDQPVLLSRLAPLIQQEIMIRLLHGSHGSYLRQLVKAGSANQKIYQVVHWLRHHFEQPIKIDQLADQSYMSPSTFRQHFRAITGMSPLQYQKQLRLQQARHLMLSQHMDAGHAAGLVGYESASQFSREYSRLFGESPQRDVQKMRQFQAI